jgi:cell division protein FtsI (penicillin-binding protein 3)
LNRIRYNLFLSILFILIVVVVIKAFNISIIKHNQYKKKYLNDIVRVIYKKGKRGSIVGYKNRVFALDYPSYDLFVDPKYYLENIDFYKKEHEDDLYSKKIQGFFKRLKESLEENPDNITKAVYKNRDNRFVVLKKAIPEKKFRYISEAFMPKGFGFIKKYRRYYPDGEFSAHDIGFCYANGSGAEGIEGYYDKYLSPELEKDIVPLDLYRYRFAKTPKNGNSIYITLNRDIQDFVHISLKKTVEKYDADGGLVIVMNPYDGSIVAMDSYPFYDNNKFGKYKYTDIRNRAVADVFEPGSVFKLVTLSAALDSGAFKGDEIVYCEKGYWRVKNKSIHDVHRFKWLGFDKVFVDSSNIGSAKIALDLGKKVFYKYLSRFGFGKKTGIDTMSESKGIVKDIFSIGDVDLANMAFGQGISVTGIQIAKSYAAIANGGYAVVPHFMSFIKDNDGNISRYKPTKKRILKNSTVEKVKKILHNVVEMGTGKRAKLDGYSVCGKTGTAQVPKQGSYDAKEYVASFAGFAPYGSPKIVVVVSIFNPKKGGFYGGAVAAPLFAKITKFILHYYAVEPDK